MESYRPRETTVEAMRQFVRSVEGAAGVFDVHRTENFDVVLPHVLVADLTRWFVAAVTAGNGQAICAFLEAIEQLYLSDDTDILNVVQVSFMEYLTVNPDTGEQAALAAMHHLAGPATVRDLVGQENRWGRPTQR
jgi:hypothetical protein